MKLICAVISVSLFLQIVQCVRMVQFIKKAGNNHESKIERLRKPRFAPWPVENCCHLPKELQNCNCCQDACIQNRFIVPIHQTCCHLPKILQNCNCCPGSCAHRAPALPEDCCHLPKRFITCQCCPAACLPGAPSLLELVPELLPLSPPIILTQESSTSSCCNLPKPFQNCHCCPSGCKKPPSLPLNESCCHWPQYLQNCACCVSSCRVKPIETTLAPTPVLTTSSTQNENSKSSESNNCCELLENLKNCNCCPQACKKDAAVQTEDTTEELPIFITDVVFENSNCCNYPKIFQNCNCCPSLCQGTTEIGHTEAPFINTCCDQPKQQQNCNCCPDACEEDSEKEVTTTDNVLNCCHLSKEFRTCKCCPEDCDAPTELLPYENCCNWPKLLQRCSCCPNACQYLHVEEEDHVVEDCCNAPLEQQDCQCCPTSPYCKLAILQRIAADNSVAQRYWDKEFDQRPETYFVRTPSQKKPNVIGSFHRRTFNSRRKPSRKTLHQVRVPYFRISADETTQEQFRNSLGPAVKGGGAIPVYGLELLADIERRRSEKDNTRSVVDDLSNSNTKESVIPRASLFQFPLNPESLMPLHQSDDLKGVSKLSSRNFGAETPINCLAIQLAYNDHDNNNKHPSYYPLHLAAHDRKMKHLITRISKRCNPIVGKKYFDLQQLGNHIYKIPPISADYMYPIYFNGHTDYEANIDYDYGGDYDDGYFPVRKSKNIKFIPISFAPFTNYHKGIPQNNSYHNIHRYNAPYANPVKVVSIGNMYRTDDHDKNDEDLFKFYAAPPKHNADILDGLAKIATGLEVNHGEVEFEPNEMETESSDDTNADGISNRFIEYYVPERVSLSINPRRNMYGIKKSQYFRRKSPFYYPNPYYNYARNNNPLNDGLIEIDIINDQFNDKRDPSSDTNFKYGNPLSIWGVLGGVDIPELTDEDFGRHSLNADKSINQIRRNQENSRESQNVESLFPMVQHNRHTRSYKRVHPHELYSLNILKHLYEYARNEEKKSFEYCQNKSRRDMVLQDMFHTLKRITPHRSRNIKEIYTKRLRNAHPFIHVSNWKSFRDNNYNKKNVLEAKSLYPTTRFGDDINKKEDDSNYWPIEYGIENPKPLDVSELIPASPLKKNDDIKPPKDDKNDDDIPLSPLVVVLTHRPSPLYSFLGLEDLPLFRRDDTTCLESQISLNSPPHVMYPEELSAEDLNLPINYLSADEEESTDLYRPVRTPIEDDRDSGIEATILKADDFYRQLKLEKNMEEHNHKTKKGVCNDSGFPSMINNNCGEEDTKKNDSGERSLFANASEVEEDENKTEVYINGNEEAITEEEDVET